jgi:hypothetical protein
VSADRPRIFLCSYWPLGKTLGGRRAVVKYGLPPYVNGMSRREPDFEHAFPSITASSRGKNFAPRLRPGDTVVYTTTKGRWGTAALGPPTPHWRLVAVLEVLMRFETHAAAAAWYRAQRHPLPGNCVVDGNPPLPVPLTLHHGALHDDDWDRVCVERAAEVGTLLACLPRYVELHDPPVVTEGDLLALLGTLPNTRTPPEITEAALDGLLALVERRTRRAA